MSVFEPDIKAAASAVARGGVILYPTDTIWGLGCDALNEAAVDRVFAIKQRPKDKSLVVLLAEARDIIQYVAAPHPDIIDIINSFDRPTTVIYEGALGFPDNLVHENGSVGIRVTTDPFCKALIKRLGRPIVSTSANISGQPSPATFEEVDASILQAVDYVVEHRRNDTHPAVPSRIVKLSEDGILNIIRD